MPQSKSYLANQQPVENEEEVSSVSSYSQSIISSYTKGLMRITKHKVPFLF